MTPQSYGGQSGQASRGGDDLYRLLAENSTEMISKHTSEGVYTYASPACSSLLGYEPEELIGRSADEFVHPDDLERTRTTPPPLPQHPDPRTVAHRMRRKDGSYAWFETTTRWVRHPGTGEPVETIAVSRDITDRKRIEERLRASEGRLRRTIDIETVGVIFFKLDGSITDANDAFLRMSGYGREDLAAGLLRWDEMTPPEWMAHSKKAIEELRSTGRTIPYEKEYVRKDGSLWRALFAATRLDEEEGVEFIIDRTERQRAREELQESERRLRALFDNTLDAILIANDDREYTEANPAACRMFGVDRNELLRSRLDDFVPEAERETAREAWRRFLESGDMEGEFRLRRKDGAIRIAEFKAKADFLPGRHLSVLRDVTERKRAQDALAEVLRARTEFMANVSHELRTPLTVIRGNAEVGLELGRECPHEEILEEILRESDSMSRMVEDLLLLARSDADSMPLEKQMVQVEWLLEELARRARALARERDATLQTTLGGKGRLRCDAQSIGQAVLVLVDNAAKHGEPGEPITLTSSSRQRELLIEVSDRGPGIPPEELSQIFERFYRGERSSRERGSGLGLAIARTIAEAHEGSVEAESRPGEGTRMSLRLPLTNGS